MAQIDEIKAKIQALRAETEENSITPDNLGLILDEMASLIGNQAPVPLGEDSPHIDISLKIEEGSLVLYPVEYFSQDTDTSNFKIRLMRHISTRDRLFEGGGHRNVKGWRIPQPTSDFNAKIQFYKWTYMPGEANQITNSAKEIAEQFMENYFPRIVVHYGRYKKDFMFSEDLEDDTREQFVVRQFGLAVFNGKTRISNIERFSIRVVNNKNKDGVYYSFTFWKGTPEKTTRP